MIERRIPDMRDLDRRALPDAGRVGTPRPRPPRRSLPRTVGITGEEARVPDRPTELSGPLWTRKLLATSEAATPAWSSRGRRVALRGGEAVLVRPIRSTDAAHVADGFARLSPRSRRARFLTGKDHLSAAELRYLTDVDHHNHEALCAMSTADGRGVAIARYIRQVDDRHAAEFALTVLDEWQHRGLGTELLTLLASRARRAGIHRARVLVATDNTAVVGLLRKLGGDLHLVRRELGTAEYEISLVRRSGRS